MFPDQLPSNTCSFSRSLHSNGATRYGTFNVETRSPVSVAYEIFHLCVTNTLLKKKLSFSTWTHTQVQGLCDVWRDTVQKPELFRMANNRTVVKCMCTNTTSAWRLNGSLNLSSPVVMAKQTVRKLTCKTYFQNRYIFNSSDLIYDLWRPDDVSSRKYEL
jgi:hypothetical protein